MFKFNKHVDQELEEGELEDDGLNAPNKPLKQSIQVKTVMGRQLDQQCGSQEYVYETVNMTATSQRKKERKELKLLQKSKQQHQKRAIRQSRSPDQQSTFQKPPIMPVNYFYGYPPQPQSMYQNVDARNMHYPVNNRPASEKYAYPHPSFHHPQQWTPNQGMYGHKMVARHPTPAYRYPQPGYSNLQKAQAPSLYGQHSNLMENNPLNHSQEASKRLENEQVSKRKTEDIKISKIREKLHAKIRVIHNSEEQSLVAEILAIIKGLLIEKRQVTLKDKTIEVLDQKLSNSVHQKLIYDLLKELQITQIVDKLKEKELQRRIIGNEALNKFNELMENGENELSKFQKNV